MALTLDGFWNRLTTAMQDYESAHRSELPDGRLTQKALVTVVRSGEKINKDVIFSSATRKNPTSVELFTGAGGLALGVAAAGFDHRLLLEFNSDACRTLRANGDTFASAKFPEETVGANTVAVRLGADGTQYRSIRRSPKSVLRPSRGKADSTDCLETWVRAGAPGGVLLGKMCLHSVSGRRLLAEAEGGF